MCGWGLESCRLFILSISVIVVDKGGSGSCERPPAEISFCLGKRWASETLDWLLWRDTSWRSDDNAAEMSGLRPCSCDDVRCVATSMNSEANMVLAGREESTASNEASDSASSGAHEGVAECRRGGIADDTSSRREPSHGVW